MISDVSMLVYPVPDFSLINSINSTNNIARHSVNAVKTSIL